jgi:hypothetical protein
MDIIPTITQNKKIKKKKGKKERKKKDIHEWRLRIITPSFL